MTGVIHPFVVNDITKSLCGGRVFLQGQKPLTSCFSCWAAAAALLCVCLVGACWCGGSTLRYHWILLVQITAVGALASVFAVF